MGYRRYREDPWDLVLKTALDAAVVMRADGTIAEWNEGAAEIFGWTREEAVGRKLAELILPERHREAHVRGLERFRRTGYGGRLGKKLDLSAVRRSGEEFAVQLKISAIATDDEPFFVGVLRDISARHAIRRELHQTGRQFQVLVQSITNYAICMLDLDGRVTSWNSGAEKITGYGAAEILGEHFSRFYTEEDRRDNVPMRALSEARSKGKVVLEGWRVRRDGSRFPASTVLDAIRDDAGKLIGFAKVTRDLSAQRDAQEALEETRQRLAQSQKMEAVGQLTGGVAHDFNNLLTVVIGNLDLAQRAAEEGDAARLRRAMGSAARAAQRGAMLTQRLLAFARQQPLDPQPVDLNHLIAANTEFLQRSLGETIEVEAVGGDGLWPVEIDRNEFETALLNLALNARDAMPGGGKLTIETSNVFLDTNYVRANPEAVRGQYVLAAVTDNGIGMTKAVAQRAFEPFFSTKAAGEGTGLGLSQVYGFIKQSGGHLKIYSEPGEGTSVKIYLPRYFGSAESQDEAEGEHAEPGSQAGETILVVEDNDEVRAFLVEVLRDLGYRALSAANSSSALRMLGRRRLRIDLLLSDVVLAGGSGRELARQAQQLRPGLKVLFMTGYSRNAIIHQGRLDPGVALIQKPIAESELAARIRDVLDLSTDAIGK